MPPNSMLKSEIRKGDAQRIQAARHAFCRIKKKFRGEKARPREPRQQDTPSAELKKKSGGKRQGPEDPGSKTRLLQN